MSISIVEVPCRREFVAGDDLAAILGDALAEHVVLANHDVVVVTQKVVSKAEGRMVALEMVEPSPLAVTFARQWDKDPRVVELVLKEARRVVRMTRGTLITQTHHGWICANSGIDLSNAKEGFAVLLPRDPDRTAQKLAAAWQDRFGVRLSVIISDTFGRPWRQAQVNVAIGIAGGGPIRDYRGEVDGAGRLMKVSALAVADELAGAAELVMNKVDGIPAAVIRGYRLPESSPEGSGLLQRPTEEDLFL